MRQSANARGYNHRWQKARATYLARNPLCTMCKGNGYVSPATVVDHIIPHKGDQRLFWDVTNWQPLCKLHHDSTKAKAEARGYSTEVGLDGWPVCPNHPANRASGK